MITPTFVSGIVKKAVMRVRQQKPEYMRKAPPSPETERISRENWKEIGGY